MVILELTDREALLVFGSLASSLEYLGMARQHRLEADGIMQRFYESYYDQLLPILEEMRQEAYNECPDG